ncbi:MAG: lysylphosphatidylglycerol synthase transmembrane domain-containing protein, partial [Caldilinea sp.]
DSLGSIVLERALDILAIVGLGIGFGWAVLRNQAPGWLMASYAAAAGLLLVLAVAAVLAPAIVGWLRHRSQHKLWQSLLNFIEQLTVSLRVLIRHPRSAALVAVESLYIWLCDALVVWFVIRSLGVALPFEIAAFVALTVDVLAAAPITPGGVGQIDAAYVAIFALLPAASLASAAFNVGAAVLLVRFITYWSFLVFSGLVTVLAGFGEVIQRARANSAPVEAAIHTSLQPSSAHPRSDAST